MEGEIGFFTAQPLMLGGEGFPLFGLVHWLYLAYSAALIALLVIVFAKKRRGLEKGSPRRTLLIVIAIIPLCLLVSQDAIMISAGQFIPQYWPLHTCNLCEALCLLYALKPNKFCAEVLFTLGIIGALAALLFPNWAYCPPWSWPVICGFTEHSLIIAFSLMLVLGGEFQPSLKRIWQPMLFVGAYLPIARVINDALHTNFMFVSAPATGSPLEGFAAVFGNPGFLIPYALLIFATWMVMYAVAAFWRRRKVPERIDAWAHRRP